jgi:hypothetical protein
LKIGHDAVGLSSILFTVGLLILAPSMFDFAKSTYQTRFRDIATNEEASLAGDQVLIPNYSAPLGISSLTIIAIGLVVTWTGFVKAIRWTLFVMFVIVWLWAFPVLVLPYFYPWRIAGSIAQAFGPSEWIRTLKGAINERGMARAFLESLVAFVLMVVALILPAKTFLLGRGGGPGESGRANSGGLAQGERSG